MPRSIASLLFLCLLGVAGVAAAGQRVGGCGGANQEACKLWQAIPSCDPWLYESVESCGFLCFVGICRDNGCGGAGERACFPFVDHGWPDQCQSGNGNVGGTCTALDADGFPAFCGHDGQPACTLDLQISLGIPSCAPDHWENGFPLGTCEALDADGFPEECGGDGEGACTLDVQLQVGVSACKPGIEERGSPIGACYEPPDMSRPTPIAWPREEALIGPRTIFLVHGAGSGRLAWDPADGALAWLLEVSTVGHRVYALDYNTDGPGAEPLGVYELGRNAEGQGVWTLVGEYGRVFDGEDFTIPDVADSIAHAIRQLDTEPNLAIVAHSLGGLVTRQLVYAHYDELRAAGKRITEVVTLGSPHQGASLDPVVLLGDLLEFGSCSAFARAQTDDAYRRKLWQNCQQQAWHEAVAELGVSIDDRDYPQIRWAVVAGTSQAIEVPFHYPFLDSDTVIPVLSAFGIAADDCFPHDHRPHASGATNRIWMEQIRFGALQEILSGACHDPRHAAAPTPAYPHLERLHNAYPAEPESEAEPIPYGHSMQDDPVVQRYVKSLLSDPRYLCGDGIDNDGDGLRDMEDPGCPHALAMIEDPQCDDGIDNNGDGRTDFDDPNCSRAWPYWEFPPSCGFGFELAFVTPLLARLRWRRNPSRHR
jgi:hypothetical protein